jgi:hypothetical protein
MQRHAKSNGYEIRPKSMRKGSEKKTLVTDIARKIRAIRDVRTSDFSSQMTNIPAIPTSIAELSSRNSGRTLCNTVQLCAIPA